MFLNDYKIVRYIKWGIYYMFKPLIRFEHMLYSRIFCHKKHKIRRLFATTGNISLINALAIINEIGNFDDYEDTLMIDTGKGRVAFFEKQKEIASSHNFKLINEIGFACGVQAVLYNQFAFDEIYVLNHPMFIDKLIPLYPNAKVILIDEGAGSLINYKSDEIKNLAKFKTHKYLNKIDFIGLKDSSKIIFEDVSVNEFKKIANKLSNKYPIEYNKQDNDKTILYCGIYWEVTGLPRDKFVEVQCKMLDDLLKVGYKILYKPHPRDNEFFGYDKNPNVTFIDSKFPIEIYNLDVVAIVSVSSTTSITPAHYWEIPCFSNIIDEALENDNKAEKISLIRRIINEYSPNYKELLKLDVKNTPREELKQQIKKIYDDFLKGKPLLSQNKKIKEYVEKHGIK